jgi:hypothetical protein
VNLARVALGVFGFDYKLIIDGKCKNRIKQFVFRSILKTVVFYQNVRLATPGVFQNASPSHAPDAPTRSHVSLGSAPTRRLAR